MKKLIVLTSLLVSSSLFAEAIPGKVLLDSFAAGCSTQGEWTRAALADSQSLIQVISAIKDDADCKSIGGAIAQLSSLSAQIENIQKLSDTQNQIAVYDAQERELLVQLSKSTSAYVSDLIGTSLYSVQMNRAGLVAQEKSMKDLSGPDKVMALSRVVQVADASFGQIVANQKCLMKNPTLLNTATGVMAAVGTAVAAVNPALGIGLTEGSRFIGTAIESYRQNVFNSSIRGISNDTVAMEGYKCALETMTDRWCNMVDAESFINYKAQVRLDDQVDPGLAEAISLSDREIPVLMDWLLRIKNGVTPQTTADGSRQSSIFYRDAMLRSNESKGLALIQQSRQEYDRITDADDRWILLRSIINTLTPPPSKRGYDSDIKNPIDDVIAPGYAPYYLIGISENDPTIRNQNGDYKEINVWTRTGEYTLDQIKLNFQSLISKGRRKVDEELTQVLQPDALQTLTTAYEPENNSPMSAMKKIIAFLEKYPPGTDSKEAPFAKLYADTLRKLRKIQDVTETAVITDGDTVVLRDPSEKTPLEEIFSAAQLTYGTVVMQARLDVIVRFSLLKLLRQSRPEDQNVVALFLASERFTDVLLRFTGKSTLQDVMIDINNAQGKTISNLNGFLKFFGKNITGTLERLVKEERAALPTVAKLRRFERAQICFLLLGADKAAEYVNVKLCEGLKLESLAKDGPSTITIDATTFRQDLKERGCMFQDYLQANRIFETWRIRPGTISHRVRQ